MDLPEIGWSDIAVAQDRDMCQALAKWGMHLRVS